MLELVEMTNGSVLFLMGITFALGFIAGVISLAPTITRLQSVLRTMGYKQ